MLRPGATWIPDGIRGLADEATASGVRNRSVLIERWLAGSERYDRLGDALRVALDAGEKVVGVGGLAHCPDVPGALRVRRFYVAVAWRRLGVGRLLATELIDEGFRHSDRLTCNARATPAAPQFWERMGFRPVDGVGISHVRVPSIGTPRRAAV
ncbi:GNAT family N-acetyltransferase [soil metagenome]